MNLSLWYEYYLSQDAKVLKLCKEVASTNKKAVPGEDVCPQVQVQVQIQQWCDDRTDDSCQQDWLNCFNFRMVPVAI